MAQRDRQTWIHIAVAVGSLAMVLYLESIISILKKLFGMFLPVIIGLAAAFILNVPMRGIEGLVNRFFSRRKYTPGRKTVTIISFLLTMACVCLVLVFVCTMAIPQLTASIKSIVELVNAKLPDWLALLKQHNIDTEQIVAWLNQFDLQELFKKVGAGTGMLISSVVGTSVSIASGLVTGAFALIIAIYALISKHDLERHCKKLLFAHLKASTAKRICEIAALISDTYSRFLSSQCIEAILLGVLIFITFSIVGLPYAALIAVLTSFFALLPYIGAVAACVIGTFLTLITDPSQALLCLVVYNIVQFVENQLIYPHVVGSSVGLSPFWTLIAALVGGKMFGVLGTIFFIPLAATLYILLKESTNTRLTEKHICIS